MILKFNGSIIKSLHAIVIVSLFVVTNSCRSQEQQFITVNDGMFINSTEPYYFIGANYWYGAILGSEGEYGDRERLIRELDHLDSIGVTNLRILVGAEGPDGEPTRVTPTLQLSPGEYNEDLLDGLDFLLAEMNKRGQYAILYLNNSWEWSGGYSQYLTWNGYGPIPYPSLPGNSWPQFMEYASQFHECENCIKQFHDHIRYILERTNKYTGLRYTEDPAIMTWEIGNEPRAFKKENLPAFMDMIASTAALIKELDENHLVTTGTEGLHGCEYSWEAFEKIHSDQNIDYLTMHIWPKNWGWLDIHDIGSSMDISISNTNKYMSDHIDVARELNKPIVLEEFGLPRDFHGYDPSETVNFRDRYYKNAFNKILEHTRNKDVLAGCNFWAYSGEGRSGGESIFWEPGDDYLGDPPQEEQGLNSVFDTDPTISLVAEYNKLIITQAERVISEETVNLMETLKSLAGEGVMFGHQDDLAYGVDWKYPDGESDVKRVCGDYPAVYGMDLGHLELGSDYNLDFVNFDHMKIFVKEIYERGGIITFSWHADNPETEGTTWDVSSKNTVKSILPGGANHEKFKQWLDRLADFFLSLTGEDGTVIPVIFRPYHEHTGSWFWWGQNLCATNEFIALWRFTYDYLCNERNVNNLLFAYSPSGDFKDQEHYLERYPGDVYVDLLGFDYYQMSQAFGNRYIKDVREKLEILTRIAKEHNKVAALTETGLERIPDPDWWTTVLWPSIRDLNVSYVLVWRNAIDRPDHFYAPFPGHESEVDFIKFYELPGTLFQQDITEKAIYE